MPEKNGTFDKVKNIILMVVTIFSIAIAIVTQVRVEPLKETISEIKKDNKCLEKEVQDLKLKYVEINGKLDFIIEKIDDLKKTKSN